VIWVVGAVAIDLIAMRERFLEGTSNPSDIRLGLGGVGYRVFGSIEAPRRFLTALADDPISRWARDALEEDGDVLIQPVSKRDAGPPLYLALMESGNLKVAASDFRIVEQALSFPWVAERMGELSRGDFLVLDANLSPSLLRALVERYADSASVVFEPVSVEKAARHSASLRGLFLLTPTAEELTALVGKPQSALSDRDVLTYMESRGVANLVVTRGRRGATLYAEGAAEDFAPGSVVETGDTTGAGDFLLAALLSRLHEGGRMRESLRAAMSDVERRLREGGL
jgi:sugar/nucleoside kinase (ribokinase family)